MVLHRLLSQQTSMKVDALIIRIAFVMENKMAAGYFGILWSRTQSFSTINENQQKQIGRYEMSVDEIYWVLHLIGDVRKVLIFFILNQILKPLQIFHLDWREFP